MHGVLIHTEYSELIEPTQRDVANVVYGSRLSAAQPFLCLEVWCCDT